MRSLLLLALLCSLARAQPTKPTQPAPPTKPVKPVDGWVIDANGPVAGAEVRVVTLSKVECPCRLRADNSFAHSEPECACPTALASYRQRLASCRWPHPARTVMRSDARGHVSLAQDALGNMLEATTGAGVQWSVAPSNADRLALELATPITGRLLVDSAVEVHAALLYDDGHCMPFRRAGTTNLWSTAAPVPEDKERAPVLIVEAEGFATVVRTWIQPELTLSLERSTPVRGTCAGDRVELDNPFQHFIATGARAKSFAFTGVLALESDVRCLRNGHVVDEWSYSRDHGLQEAHTAPSFVVEECSDVRVVDRRGQPIAGAELRFHAPLGSNGGPGTMTYTDARGRACLEHVFEGGELIAHPPADRGGWCAGTAKLAVTKRALRKPLRVVLEVQPLSRSRSRGRVLSPERQPVVGALVTVRGLRPAATPDCHTGHDELHVETGPDGKFELPLLPQGALTLQISHEWYASQEVELTLPSTEREIQLDRGLTWNGRVLDPEGRLIDRCELSLRLPDQRLITSTCAGRGFSFRTLVPGKAKLTVQLEGHALGTRRLIQVIEILPGQSSVADVQWPPGETIAGRVLDVSGAPIAGARLIAVPKGTAESVDRLPEAAVMLEADRDGRFAFRSLTPGVWTIRGGNWRTGAQTVRDLSTGATDVQFVTSR